MNKAFSWIKGFLSNNGEASSKRLVGVMCASFLCGAMLKEYNPSDSLVFAVSGLAFGCLGLTSAEKIFDKKKNENGESK
jgi:hypothetical protein